MENRGTKKKMIIQQVFEFTNKKFGKRELKVTDLLFAYLTQLDFNLEEKSLARDTRILNSPLTLASSSSFFHLWPIHTLFLQSLQKMLKTPGFIMITAAAILVNY